MATRQLASYKPKGRHLIYGFGLRVWFSYHLTKGKSVGGEVGEIEVYKIKNSFY